MSPSLVANSLLNKCSSLQGEVLLLLGDLKQKNSEIDALKTSLKVLGYGDLLYLVKARKKRSADPKLPYGLVSRLSGEYIRLKVDKESTFRFADVVAYIMKKQGIVKANNQLTTNVFNYLRKQEDNEIITEV